MKPHKRLSLKNVPESKIRLTNRFFSRNRCLPIPLGDDIFHINFYANQNSILPQLTFRVRIDGCFFFTLSIGKPFISDLFFDLPLIADITALPPTISLIALEVALEEFLDQFDGFCGCKSIIDRLGGSNDAEREGIDIPFSLTRSRDGLCVNGLLNTDSKGLSWLMEHLNRIPEPRRRDWKEIPIRGIFEVGDAVLALSELKALQSNDIIVLSRSLKQNETPIAIRFSNSLSFTGILMESGKIIVDRKLTSQIQEVTMSEIKNATVDNFKVLTDDLPVNLSFEIGEIQLTIAELERIQPGFTFDTGTDIEKSVTIKANGKVIGTGDMLQIGDKIGVRVIEFTEDTSKTNTKSAPDFDTKII